MAAKKARWVGRIVTSSVWAASSALPSLTSCDVVAILVELHLAALIASNSSRVRGEVDVLVELRDPSSVALDVGGQVLGGVGGLLGVLRGEHRLRMKRAWALARRRWR